MFPPQGAAFCRHELERCQLPPRNLHERMMLEAEPICRHNWSDIAIHDRDKLSTVPVGHACIWIVGEAGSYLTPLYCRLSERSKWSADPLATLAPVQTLVIRWHSQAALFGGNAHWRRNHDPVRDKKCYLVVKTDSHGAGTLTPIPYRELASLCVYGQVEMVVDP